MSSRNLSQFEDEDVFEYTSLSSCDSSRVERPERLHEWLDQEAIQLLHHKFTTHPKQKMTHSELREVLEELNIKFTDLEYNRVFLKMNQNRDFRCDWNEFISYLIYGFQEDDPSTQKEALILPISTPPVVKKSEHRSAVCCISLLRAVPEEMILEEEEDDKTKVPEDTPEHTGIWLTASREGQIRFWTPHLEHIRTGMSSSIYLKMSTWVLAMQALSDVSIICISSTEREIRFHETVASTFTLRLVIRSLPFAVNTMSYSFHPKGTVKSKLVFGDYGGNVRVLEFDPFLRGPFQNKTGSALLELFWWDILKGKMPAFQAHEYLNIHSELIQKAFFSIRLNSLFVAAEYRNTKKYRGRCPGLILVSGEEKIAFRIPLGVTTFFVDEKTNVIATGGPDMFVRIWDVYISSKPTGILTGHNGGIVMVFVQSDEKKVYSLDYQKIIKVWHLVEYTLLQTFSDLVRWISKSETDLVYYYHRTSRELLVGGRKLICIKCCPRVRVDLTDGSTHAAPVSVVLYNRLFRNVVTCGLDSYIIVWDPWTGRRKIIMKNCHTKMVYGETIDIEITAACFDPLEQFLLTGARDGSLKIWNYNNAVCIRNMNIKNEHEVTAVIWVIERILAVGWDQQVTEFNDVEGREYGDAKKWKKYHNDDITCAAVKLGEGVVTATYSGEVIFWKLETGQPYRRYHVSDPTRFIELKHNIEQENAPGVRPIVQGLHVNVLHYVRKSVSSGIRALQDKHASVGLVEALKKRPEVKLLEENELSAENILAEYHAKAEQTQFPISVQSILFLQTRPMTKNHGSILVALDTGIIQVYSHHQRGGFIKQFNSIHKTGDCVLTMTTDRKNRFLFTGTAFGYLKVWHIENYCIPDEDKTYISMPRLRLQFQFLRKERILTRAKRVVRDQPEPILVNSFKGHLKAINSIVYINMPKILFTGSHDCSCRIWSLGGRYLGTLGTPLPWLRLSPFDPPDEDHPYRMPPDIKKVASSTSMRVISGVDTGHLKLTFEKERMDEAEDTRTDDFMSVYGRAIHEPILGKHFSLPGKSAMEQRIELDSSLSYTPVFSHLKIHEAEDLHVGLTSTPHVIKYVRNENYMEFYERDRTSQNADGLRNAGSSAQQ